MGWVFMSQPGKTMQALEDARLAGSIRSDQDRQPFQLDFDIPKGLEILESDRFDHGIVSLTPRGASGN
jgi:hypothetical protein